MTHVGRTKLSPAIFGLSLALLFGGSAQAQQASADIEPSAVEALKRMAGFLRSLKAFQVEADSTNEEVLDTGEKVQFSHHVNMVATRTPDRFVATVLGDQKDRVFVYDGKTFTFMAQRLGYYASVPAPSDLGGLVDQLDKYDIEIPLVDLFLWGTPRDSMKLITSAADVGPAAVGGITCQHYAFRQPGVDWQIWIQNGDFPIPRKFVITTLTDEARPQSSSILTWNLAPSYNDAAFQFNHPDNARRIVFAEQKQ